MSHKILIVECDPPSSSRSVRVLRSAGFRVVVPASSTTAMATFDRVRPDLVLVGKSLPNDGAAQLCRGIKETPHGGRTPVALLLDEVGIDLPPMDDLGWARLIESAVGDGDLVSICRQLIETRDTPTGTAAAEPEAEPAANPDDRSLEDAIDQVLTFEHEESVAHIRRSTQPVPTPPEAPSSAVAKPAQVAEPVPAPPVRPATQPERPRFQTAAVLGTKPEPAEAPQEKPVAPPSSPSRRWWIAGAIGVGAVAIVVAAWIGLWSGGDVAKGPASAQAPADDSGRDTGPVAAGLSPIAVEPVPEASEPGPEVAEKPAAPKPKSESEPVVAKKQEPAPEPPAPKPEPTREPVAAKKQEPAPTPPEPKPEPVIAEKQPEPEPAPPKSEPVAVENEPEPVVAKKQEPAPAPPEPEPTPEPVVAMKQPEPAPAPPEPEPVTVENEPEPEKVEPAEPVFVAPVLAHRVEPTPSPKAVKKNRGATIVLRLLVNEQGSVIRVVVDQGIPGSELEAAAVNAVLRWKYEPATRGGTPVQDWTEVRFTFE